MSYLTPNQDSRISGLLGPDLRWITSEAACREAGTEAFFPDSSADILAAKKVCDTCPLLEQCRQYARTHRVYGVWGGTLYRERVTVEARIPVQREPAKVRELQPCGTRGAYRRHLYRKEVPCDPCLKAANAARRQQAS